MMMLLLVIILLIHLIVKAECNYHLTTLTWRQQDLSIRSHISVELCSGDPIPCTLIEKVDVYLPDDVAKLLDVLEDENSLIEACNGYSWIHSDIMDDNIHMEPCLVKSCGDGDAVDCAGGLNSSRSGYDDGSEGRKSWCPSHILDFSDLSIGDPIFDLIPIYLDVFRGDTHLLNHFLESYKLPLQRSVPKHDSGDKFGRLSYRAMCFCILHDENVLGAIFSLWKDLTEVNSWEEIELTVWGEMNNYKGFT